MQVAFRVDAGMAMGTGHVMRCATLAHALIAKGNQVCFYSRPQQGDLCSWLLQQGFNVVELEPADGQQNKYSTMHGAWLGTTQQSDAEQTLAAIKLQPNLWVVDHYGLDANWHCSVANKTPLLVIDDLADRQYEACLLLDQNLGRLAGDYSGLTNAKLLAGLDYVLLREEFVVARERSMVRQHLKHIVITMGGVDQPNATGLALSALLTADMPSLELITVILGQANPHRVDIECRVKQGHTIKVEVVQGVANMAELLCAADLAIGAAGTTSWERCAVGLPTVIIELAANQKLAADALAATGAAEPIGLAELTTKLAELVTNIATTPGRLSQMSQKAYQLVDAKGTERVVANIERQLYNISKESE